MDQTPVGAIFAVARNRACRSFARGMADEGTLGGENYRKNKTYVVMRCENTEGVCVRNDVSGP